MNFREFLDIPTVTKTSKIRFIEDKKNPILIQLEDGTRLLLNLDQFRRIHARPSVGKEMTVVLQRSPWDSSQEPSQVQSCEVH